MGEEELKVQMIDLSEIEEQDCRVDHGLLRSIVAHGIVHPVRLECVGLPVDGGCWRYRIVDGRRRVAAARSLGIEQVPALVYRVLSDDVRQVIVLLSNLQRSPNPMMEAESLYQLLSEGWSEDRITKELGISKARYRQRYKLLDLNSNLQEKLRVGEMTLGAALEATKLLDEDQEELGCEEGRVTQAEVSAKTRMQQMQLLDLGSVDIPPPMSEREQLAVSLTQIAQDYQGQKRQVLLEAAVVLEQSPA